MMKKSMNGVLPISDKRSYYEENNWTGKILNVEMADVTHDGVADFIVTIIMLPPTVDIEEEDVDTLLYEGGEGYVQVFDGGQEFDLGNPGFSRPIWEEPFAAARPGNIQISLVQRAGRYYLLLSNISSYFGRYNFWYQVLALDAEGRVYVVDGVDLTLDTYNYETHEQMPLSDEQLLQIKGFRESISKWFEEAVLLAGIGEVNLVTTPRRRYTPEEFYDVIWRHLLIRR